MKTWTLATGLMTATTSALACTVDGDCGESLVLDGRNGVFYERTAIAIAGVAVWSWDKKG